ncbi:type III pantothenate kinase [Candidatus Kinetoplastibacterium blastocrithidii TCC012E]|uniref:Type III pantothenate kinase n=1 Tax=Candidatus Kinetoplastidibacterium blastocrithidiae TCC012E TaxID=1208922 RepID=M1LCE5_9PROT|nr:type III pantothenate kinase [Candidatus Kinetoplastibacterium blastocrithidii]AFZ83297.1 pantothenate kinase [Candidatus Kinetoplastibacterium blastocrithidii (ex Strigomonas culicis)]AGF50113.1 type III pantothenate kinase [Candidatus Kinetoplastibacterium blastocrithidii TCC012E]
MILLIDSGNSRIKIGWSLNKNGCIHREPHVKIFDNLNIRSLGQWLSCLPKKPNHALGVNVAGKHRENVIENELNNINCKIEWIVAQTRTSILINEYKNPNQLGADRWAAMLGIVEKQKKIHPPLIVASFGTTTTIDIISPNNIFIGGIILPGSFMMRQSLTNGTANLPMSSGESIDLPLDTINSINSGVSSAQSGALARQCIITFKKYNEFPIIYVTGGLWLELEKETRQLINEIAFKSRSEKKTEIIYENRPVLDGLAIISRNYN